MRRFPRTLAPAAAVAAALGLASLAAGGLVGPDDPIPAAGESGAPHTALTPAEQERFLRGRRLFDQDFLSGAGVGPVFNGDSCRACHLDPVVGGAGGIDVQVQRPAIDDGQGGFVPPPETGPLAQTRARPGFAREEIPADVAFVEERNSPTLLGLGLVQAIRAEAIRANADPDDTDGDGIRGIPHDLPGGGIGRLGWKADIPDVRSFVRDAMANELGITVPFDPANGFGIVSDADDAPDPEISATDVADLAFFVSQLDFPPKLPETPASRQGETLFATIGCAKCHVPVLDGVEAYTDLLLHDVQAPGFAGVTQGLATSGLYRTAPLRGLRDTAPYFHDGRSETVEDAVRRHDGEARAIRETFEALAEADRQALLAFLESL